MAPGSSPTVSERGPVIPGSGRHRPVGSWPKAFPQAPSLVGSRGVAEVTHSLDLVLSREPEFVFSLDIS